MNLAHLEHPLLGKLYQTLQPVVWRRNEPAIFHQMLFCDQLDGDGLIAGIDNGMTKLLNCPLNACAVMPQCTMRPISGMHLGFIKPVVNSDIILPMPAPFACSRFCVFYRCHFCILFSNFQRSTLRVTFGALHRP